MAVIKTKLNFVYAYEPLPGDTHVLTLIRSPTERYTLTTQPAQTSPVISVTRKKPTCSKWFAPAHCKLLR